MVMVRSEFIMVMVMLDELAEAYPPLAVMSELMWQVPWLTNATRPLFESTVQTPVVEPVNVIVPLPAEGVAVRVGGVSVKL